MKTKHRVLASNGYVLIFVGKDHHLADVRGYTYEHRAVAERAIGRRLRSKEVVHHRDHVKTNNTPENLEVLTRAEHRRRHASVGGRTRAPGQRNPMVCCACGCGWKFRRFDSSGRPRRFVSGHNESGARRG